jgi:SAM-dependent methyltransferase
VTRYTHGHHESVLRSHRWRTAENSCAYLLPHLRPDMTLLDVGCGPATITADLAKQVASVVGIDPSRSVIDEARRDFPSLDLRVDDLFTHDGHYDVVHAHQVIHHVGDPVAGLRRMAELGHLVAVRDADYTAFQWEPASPALDAWRELYLAVARRNGGAPDAGRHLLRWAHEAGLRDITYTTSTWTFATQEDVTWWAGTWVDRALQSSFADQAVEYGLASREDLQAISDGWRAWGREPHAHITLLHGELLARVS